MAASTGVRKGMFFLFVLFEITFIILYRTIASFKSYPGLETASIADTMTYLYYTHIMALTLLGFGFFYSFGKQGNLIAVVYTLGYGAFALQWGLLVNEFWYRVFTGDWSTNYEIEISDLIYACYTTVSMLVTANAVLGKVSYIQLVWVGVVEIIMYGLNQYILRDNLNTVSGELHLYVFEFGAFFALGYVFLLKGGDAAGAKDSSRSGNLTALFGTFLLFAFFPSFNAFPFHQEQHNRVIVNTYLALVSAAVTSFTFSGIFNKDGKVRSEDVRNGTLAGGIAMSSSIAAVNGPAAALGTGLVAALVVVLFLNKAQKLADKIGGTGGLNLTYLLATLVAGVGTMITLADAADQGAFYGSDFAEHYASNGDAADNEVAAYFITLGIAFFSGLITAAVFKAPVFQPRAANAEDGDDYLLLDAVLPSTKADVPLQNVTRAVPAPAAPYVPAPAPAVYVPVAAPAPIAAPAPAPVAAPAPALSRAVFATYSSDQVANWLSLLGLGNLAPRVLEDGIIGADVLESPADRLSAYFGAYEADRITAAIRQMA